LNAGDAFIEIEAMKMYMPLKVPESGVVHFMMSDGATLSPGDLVATMTLDNPETVVKSEDYVGVLTLDEFSSSPARENLSLNPHVALRESLKQLVRVLEGYSIIGSIAEKCLVRYMSAIESKLLPYYVSDALCEYNSRYRDLVEAGGSPDYPADDILKVLYDYLQSSPDDRKASLIGATSALWDTIEYFLYPSSVRLLSGLLKLVEIYLNTEQKFDDMSFTDVVSRLRKENQNDLLGVYTLCRSHVNINAKNRLMIRIVEELKRINPPSISQRSKLANNVPLRSDLNIRQLKRRLTELSALNQPVYSHVALSANLVLMEQYTLTLDQRRHRLNEVITAALLSGDPVGKGERALHLQTFAETNIAIRDLLLECLGHDREYQFAFIELYLRKIYQKTHNLTNMTCGHGLTDDGSDRTIWLKFNFLTRSVDAVSSSFLESSVSEMLSFSDLSDRAKARSLNTAACSDSENEDDVVLRDSLSNRCGIFVSFESMAEMVKNFVRLIEKLPAGPKITPLKSGPVNVCFVAITSSIADNDEETSAVIASFLVDHVGMLNDHGVRRITFLVSQAPSAVLTDTMSSIPSIFNFKASTGFVEDRLYRQIESTHAYHLELRRLSNFSISLVEGLQTVSGNVHLYRATPKSGSKSARYFARLISFPADQNSNNSETLFVEALDQLSVLLRKAKSSKADSVSSNHIFVNVVAPDLVVQPEAYVSQLKKICTKYSQKLVNLAISNVEMKITCRLTPECEPMHIRMVAANPTGFVLHVDQYYEEFHQGTLVFRSATAVKGEWDSLPVTTPYSVFQKFEDKRAEALTASDTLYVYDWPVLFMKAVENAWDSFIRERPRVKISIPDSIFECKELVLCESGTETPLERGWTALNSSDKPLVPLHREPGLNDVGMVAWLIRYNPPECPDGRRVVIICNDITHQAGSFGTKEDLVFFKASEFARKEGIPRLYLAANSGARIGMAKGLQDKFHVSWLDSNDPTRGFQYIYLKSADYATLLAKAENDISRLPVICRRLEVPNEEPRMIITDVIGEEPDLGVENLMGSGLIAGETSRAYDAIFTLTLVIGRTVGIGAYLVRLGQRTIQKTRMSPIILTGYQVFKN
jgi:acetyl-CoA carboxylase/biotin carboxylase 1